MRETIADTRHPFRNLFSVIYANNPRSFEMGYVRAWLRLPSSSRSAIPNFKYGSMRL
jgi:hypothetical protein